MTQTRVNGTVPNETPIAERASVEVRPIATRRQFSAGYRRRIVEEAAGLTPEERGALLRREGLDSSYLAHWKAELNPAESDGRASHSHRRGPKPDPKLAELRQLERENIRLTAKLKQAELIIEAQKKLAEIFGAVVTAAAPATDRIDGGR